MDIDDTIDRQLDMALLYFNLKRSITSQTELKQGCIVKWQLQIAFAKILLHAYFNIRDNKPYLVYLVYSITSLYNVQYTLLVISMHHLAR